MKTKITQSLPLLGTFLALIIGGGVLMKFTPADAVLDATAEVPPVNAATDPSNIVSTTTADETTTAVDVNSGDETTDDANADDAVIMDPLEFDYTASDTGVTGVYMEANSDIVLDDHYLNDVYVAGSNIHITGTVEGDVFAAGSNIIVDGDVMGSVRAAGQTIEINGAVERNVMAFAANVNISKSSHVGKDVMVNAAQFDLNAMVMGDVLGNVGSATIDAPVEGNVQFGDVGTLTLDRNAYVMGDVTYASQQAATIADAATILGEVNFNELVRAETDEAVALKAFVSGFKFVFAIISWIGFLIFGIVLIKLLPKYSERVLNYLQTKPAQSIGYGIVALIIPPMVLVTIAFTVFGLPLAIAGGLVYVLAIMVSKIYAGVLVGKLIWKQSKGLVGPFVLGYTLLSIVFLLLDTIGFLGSMASTLLSGLLLVTAFGAVVKTCQDGRNL